MIILKAAAVQLKYPAELIDDIVDKEMSGEEGLKQIENGKTYKLIITDLSMPIMDGYQMTDKIRQYIASQLLP